MKCAPTLPDEDRRLRRLQALDVMDTGAEAALDAFTSLAAQMSGMPIALISLVDHERQWFKSAVGLPQGAQTSREVSFCGHAIAHDGIFEIEDASADPDFADNPLVTGPPHVVHYAGVPLRMPDGERIGTLCLIDHKPGRLASRDRELLAGLGRSVVATLLLRESERHLRRDQLLGYTESLAEFSPTGLFAADSSGALVHANARWMRLLGVHDLADGLGWAWTAQVDPRHLPALLQSWDDAVRERRSLEVLFPTREGSAGARWLRLRLEPADTSLSAAAFIGAVVDVTQTRDLERQLHERNELLESVVENLPCGLAVFDADLDVVTHNRRLTELLDLPPHLLRAQGASFRTLVTYGALRGEFGPGDPDVLAAERADRLLAGDSLAEKRARANGTVLDIRSGRMPSGGLVRIYTDITAEKRAARALRESESRLAIALEGSGLALWDYEPQADRVHLSESWARFFGHEPRARTLSLAQVGDLAPAYVGAECRGQLVQLLKGEIERLYLEHEMLDAQGRALWVATRAQVTERDEAGRAVRVVGTTKNVTERRETQAALAEAAATADRANRAKADFLSTMSHEIRTPINGVIGLARMLEDARLPEKEAGYVRMINSCASTLLALVNDVLDFSKIEAGQMELESIDTDLQALVQETADIFRARAEDKGVAFSVHLDPQVPRGIMADPHRLRQVLLNLLGNALKFTNSGGFSLRCALQPAQGAARLRFDVTDSGIGISPEGQARLFKRFSQAEAGTARQFHGTGLGLAISRDLAQLMGGELTVASTLGVGSTFTLVVPLVPSRASAPPAATAVETAAAADAAILLVEDNAINQLVARTLLAKLGYRRVTLAEDGEKALARCLEQRFDLVLMDCQMPVMDGYEATRRLRRAGFDRPIVALTAGAVAQDREACLAAGMDDYLAKPIDGAQLAACVARWLQARVAAAAH